MTMSDNTNLIDNVPIPAGLFDGLSNVQVGRIYAYANQCAARFKESADALRAERDALRGTVASLLKVGDALKSTSESVATRRLTDQQFTMLMNACTKWDIARSLADQFDPIAAAIAAEKESHS